MERVRLARIVMRLAGRLMTVAENLTLPDLRRRPYITHDIRRRARAVEGRHNCGMLVTSLSGSRARA